MSGSGTEILPPVNALLGAPAEVCVVLALERSKETPANMPLPMKMKAATKSRLDLEARWSSFI
jgi:hypothetical protein